MVSAALLESPRAFSRAAATALGGERIVDGGVASYVSSRFDPFLNQAFVEPGADPVIAARRLDVRPGFVWMQADATAGDGRAMREAGFRQTRERFRRRGLARSLIAACRGHARRRHVPQCVLQATPAGRPVYAGSGFAAIGTLEIFVRR